MALPYQGGEVVLRLPILDPSLPVAPRDRVTETEVNALMRHIQKRSRGPRPAGAVEMLCAVLEVAARFMSGASIASGMPPSTLQGFRELADHMVRRATEMVEGRPFGPPIEPAAARGSSTEIADLIDLLPPLAEEGDIGVLAHNLAAAIALQGLKVFDEETRSLTAQEKAGALLIASAEATTVTLLCSSNPERACEALGFVLERIKARAEQAIDARKAKMG
jgi:hypothetical protein